ncbi:ferric reductase-like transmembrane domain-containing protein [Actinoalloteichus spitiensis]|uniref:ferric reductase-like transmembrane domain-containing protein n=1 Tax=Actinoalloteichus spitiensis TaxID=252394 RepID=UPI000360D5A4|nr:ferric reductase-like transmembrane domain-containing protein [Actinoalloteichus spitiensis]
MHTDEPAAPAPRRDRRDRTLRSDLRAVLPDLAIALLVTASVYGILHWRIDNGTSDTVLVMPFMADAAANWPYWLSQAFGWSALLWSWVTVLFGLLVGGSRPAWIRLRPATVERLHRTTSLTVIALIFAHALVLSWDSGNDLLGAFVPGLYSHAPGRFAVAIGVIAFWLALPMGLTYYVRNRMGPRLWRLIHRFIIVVYVLGIWHTFLWGTNVWFTGGLRTVLWVMQVPVALLFLWRLLYPARRGERVPWRPSEWSGGLGVRDIGSLVLRLGAAAVVVALLVVIATGNTGGADREDYPKTSTSEGGGHEHHGDHEGHDHSGHDH